MFVSTSSDLKFHALCGEPSLVTYKPLQPGIVISTSWSKDNAFLTFVSENSKPEIVSLKDPNNIKNVHIISAVNGASSLAFQRTTKRVIGIGTTSGQAALYDTKNKSISKLFQNAPCPINLLDFNADDKQMVVSCINGNVLLYNVAKSEICETYATSNNCCPTSLRFHPADPRLLAVGVEDGTLTYWDVDSGKTKFSVQIHSAPITGLVLIKNTNSFISVGYDHKFCIHDVNSSSCVFRSNLQHPLTAVDASFDGVNIVVGSAFGNLYSYDIRNLLTPLTTSKPHNTKIGKVLFENAGRDDFIDHIADIPNVSPVYCDVTADLLAQDQEPPNNAGPAGENENKLLPETIGESNPVSIKTIKEEVELAVRRGGEELQEHVLKQMANLHDFILSEFRNITMNIDEKWNLENFIGDDGGDLENKEPNS